jgi:hypothetical protein
MRGSNIFHDIFRNISYNKCSSYCFVNINVKVTNCITVFHIAYNESSNWYTITMKMKVIAMTITMGLLSTLGILTTLHTQFAFAGPLIGSPLTTDFDIQSNGDNSGYIVCDPNCHMTTTNNSSNSNNNSSNSEAQLAYRLTVNVPSHPFGISTVGISITTENGHTDQTNVPTAGGSSYTFNIPKNQGKWVQVCVNFGQHSTNNCHTYEITGSDMSVSLSAVSPHSAKHNLNLFNILSNLDD